MATVPSPPTFTDGVMITAANLNAALKEPCDFLANTKPHVFLRQFSATTSIPNTTWTSIAWDFEDVDTDSGFSTGTPTYYVIKTAGYYLITGHLNYDNTSTANSRMARLAYATAAAPTTIIAIPGAVEGVLATTVATGLCVTAMRSFAVNDRVHLQGYQNSGIAVNTNLNYFLWRNETSYLDLMWVGA